MDLNESNQNSNEPSQGSNEVLQVIISILFAVASPLTFVYLIYQDAQVKHTFFEWLVLIICDSVLAAMWPLFWVYELLRHLF